ncbi:MAG: amidohydrolase family protein [Desulfovibrionaceae bacterium]|nr:amidohydrolase family protein [Desulfovibrionaceae bacterium]
MTPNSYALKARTIITLEGEKPARGEMLFAPLKKIDNGLILTERGRIVAVGKESQIHIPASCPLYDVGDYCLIPAVVNAHTHLDLSHLQGQTTWGEGFTSWLKSLIPLLPRNEFDKKPWLEDSQAAMDQMVHLGTRYVGDIAGSIQGLLFELATYAQKINLNISHFCEWLGYNFEKQNKSPWPTRVMDDLLAHPEIEKGCAPSGHALYSLAPQKLRASKQFCEQKKRTFALHLAESPDETEMLVEGRGPLYELYRDKILPKDWKAPFMRPLAYAAHLKLLGSSTLAIHGTQLDTQEAQVLAISGTSLCLCPRSNYNLGLGLPKVEELIVENVLLCLGTDGLTSNKDLDVCNEAVFLQAKLNIPPEALIRMLTINGAQALGLKNAGRLIPGTPANVCALPAELCF